jgi:hypothetical protein
VLSTSKSYGCKPDPAASFPRKQSLDSNRHEAQGFLALLDPNTSYFSFQVFDDNKERAKAHAAANVLRKKQGQAPVSSPFARILHGTLARHWKVLVHLNALGAGIYVTVNQTNLRGRKASDIVRVRCLFLDLDGAPLPRSGPAPHFVVETSPGHWHVYWRVEDVGLDKFTDKQRALIALHGGDPAVCDLPRVMRLPGFFHCKRDPQLVRIVSTTEAPSYRASDFPTAAAEPRQASAELTADEGYLARALAFLPNTDVDWKAWCDLGLAIYGATSGSAAGLDMFVAWSKRSDKYDARETLQVWDCFERSPPDRIGAGTIIFKATQASPKWADLLDDGDDAAHAVVASFLEAMK